MGELIEEHTSSRALFQLVDWVLILSYCLILIISIKRMQNQRSTHYEDLLKALLCIFIITSICNIYLVRINLFLQIYIDFPSEILIVFLILPTYLFFFTPLIFIYILADFHISLKLVSASTKYIYGIVLKIICFVLCFLILFTATIFIVLTCTNHISKTSSLGVSISISACYWFITIMILVIRGCRLKSYIKQLNYGIFGNTLINSINLISVFAIIFYVICTSIIVFCSNFYADIENENLQ